MAKTKAFLSAFLIALMISGLAFVGNARFGEAQSGTNVSGTITSDTTWTLANSPYNFIGDVTVANDVTLTIDSGVQVDFQQTILTHDQYGRSIEEYVYYNFEIDGTLLAIGETSAITFDYGSRITFSSSSSGSVLQNVNFEGENDGSNSYSGYSINIIGSSPKFDEDSFNVPYPSIDFSINGGSPIIENNIFGTNLFITVSNSAAQVSNNTVNANIAGGPNSPESSFISLDNSSAVISDNNISGYYSTSIFIINSGTPSIARNFINNYNSQFSHTTPSVGMVIYGTASPVIENNTFAENDIGLNIYDSNGSPMPIIEYNNFEQNSQYNIYLGQQGVLGSTSNNVDAAYNWWGTTDIPTINQTIYDYKNNYNVGTVTFTPILTSPNPEAVPNPNEPITTPAPTSTQLPSPSSPTTSKSTPPSTSSPSTSQSRQSVSSLTVELTVAVMAIAIIAVAIGAFLLGKKAGRKQSLRDDYSI